MIAIRAFAEKLHHQAMSEGLSINDIERALYDVLNDNRKVPKVMTTYDKIWISLIVSSLSLGIGVAFIKGIGAGLILFGIIWLIVTFVMAVYKLQF